MYFNCYHGTTKEFAKKMFSEKRFLFSRSNYDWLGTGAYFFQDAPLKAWHWALNKARESGGEPSVIYVQFKADNCLDLLSKKYWLLCQEIYDEYSKLTASAKSPLLHQHEPLLRDFEGKRRRIFSGKIIADDPSDGRNLPNSRMIDNHIVNMIYEKMSKHRTQIGEAGLTSVRCAFAEGRQLYRGSGFFDHTNVQFVFKGSNKTEDSLNFHSEHLSSYPSLIDSDLLSRSFDQYCGDYRWPI